MSIHKVDTLYVCRCQYCGKEYAHCDKDTLINRLTSLGWSLGGKKHSYCSKCYEIIRNKARRERYDRVNRTRK